MATTQNTQNNKPQSSPRGANRTQRELSRLPFKPKERRGDWADWVFKHRIGLLITVVIYLSLAIMFVTYKIVVSPAPIEKIEIEMEEEMVKEIEEMEQKIEQMEQMTGGPVRNKVSNDDSKFDETLRDSKNSNASEIYEEAERMQRELEQGRKDYERSLREIEESENKPKTKKENIESKKGSKNQDAFVRGNVTMAFTLEGRTIVYRDIPAYMCEGGGQVLVNITVNRNGKVIAARVEKATSTSDRCLMDEAVSSAKKSSFNASTTAPDPQRGTILYTFIAQ